MTERKTPILLRTGGLSGRVYALTRYVRRSNDLIVASQKQDVTQDFYRVAAEMWPHLVTDGYLTPKPIDPGGEPS